MTCCPRGKITRGTKQQDKVYTIQEQRDDRERLCRLGELQGAIGKMKCAIKCSRLQRLMELDHSLRQAVNDVGECV